MSQSIPSMTEAMIAHLLRSSAEPLFGQELVRRSNGQLKRGTIYTTLERMESKGLVRSELERPAAGGGVRDAFAVPRRFYRLTPAGRDALRRFEAAVAQVPGFLVRRT